MTTTTDIVQKLWSLCHVLRDDGITYHQYVTELTWLLFLKMTKETGKEDQLPKGYRWGDVEILGKLQIAMDEIESLQRVLRGEP